MALEQTPSFAITRTSGPAMPPSERVSRSLIAVRGHPPLTVGTVSYGLVNAAAEDPLCLPSSREVPATGLVTFSSCTGA
jgi:hypothetical protein